MLFILDESVADLFAGESATAADMDALDTLVHRVAEGQHRLTASRRVLQRVMNQASHHKTRATLHRSYSRIAQEGELRHRLAAYAVVDANPPTGAPASTSVGSQRVIRFPLRWFDSSAKVQATRILGEHVRDAAVLEKLAAAGAHIAGLPYLPISAERDHGGGSTVGVVLQLSVGRDRLCVCVVDSDRSYPGGPLGGTARSAEPFKDPASHPLTEVMETSGRDLENVLPDSFYRRQYGATHGRMASVLEHLTAANEWAARAHLDIEKGLTLQQIFDNGPTSLAGAFWHGKLAVILQYLGIVATSFPCWNMGVCFNDTQQPKMRCTCIVVPGNGADILKDFRASVDQKSRYEIAATIDDSVRIDWQRIGLVIASWCCGDSPLRI